MSREPKWRLDFRSGKVLGEALLGRAEGGPVRVVEVDEPMAVVLRDVVGDANRAADAEAAADLVRQERDAARESANRSFDRAQKLEEEAERLRAAQPPPEPADVQALRAEVGRLEKLVQHWTCRTEGAEHEARVWASGKTGDVATIHSYALRSQGLALDACMRREGEIAQKLRAAECDISRWRDRALAAEGHLDRYIQAIEPTVDRALAAHRRLAEANEEVAERQAAIDRLRAKLDEMSEEVDAAKRAIAPAEDPGEPLTLNLDPAGRGGFFVASVYCGACREEDDLFISGLSVDRVEADRLAEMVRCYNLIHHDTDGTPEGERFDRALKTATEKLVREDSRLAASRIFPDEGDELKRGIAASLIFNVISGKDRKPAATVGEAVDRAMAPILSRGDDDTHLLNWLGAQSSYGGGWVCRPSTTGRGWRLHETSGEDASGSPRAAIREAMKRREALAEATKAAAKAGDGDVSEAFREKMEYVLGENESPTWDRTMAQALDAQVGGEAQSFPVEGEIGPAFVADGPGGNAPAEPPIVTLTFTRRSEQGTGERILEVREAEHEEGAELHSFYERWPEDFAVAVPAGDGRLLINGEPPATPVRVLAECNYQTAREAVNLLNSLPVEGNARAAIAAEESRRRAESLAIPSFAGGALWMWKLLTGREAVPEEREQPEVPRPGA